MNVTELYTQKFKIGNCMLLIKHCMYPTTIKIIIINNFLNLKKQKVGMPSSKVIPVFILIDIGKVPPEGLYWSYFHCRV